MLLSCPWLFNYAVSALECFYRMYSKSFTDKKYASCPYAFWDSIMRMDSIRSIFCALLILVLRECWIRADVVLFNSCVEMHSIHYSILYSHVDI